MTNFIGIDVGGTNVKTVVLDDNGNRVHESRVRLPESAVVETVVDLASGLRRRDTAGVGVGVAGLVAWPEGQFVWGPHVSGQAVDYRARVREGLGGDLAVVVDNDANLAALAEVTVGAASGRRHALVLTFGTGIGAGLVIDEVVYRGGSFAGEVGHMTMVPGGDLCACGRRGCWETLVSGARFDRLAAELLATAPEGLLAGLVGEGTPTGSHLTAAADAGDSAAQRVLADAGMWLGRGVANLAAILDPDIVVVGGAAAQAGEWLLEPARQTVRAELEGAAYREPVPIVQGQLGAWAGAVGAAIAAARVHRG